jgi:3-hydroxybutyryl-CoA dehydrogenase
VDNFRTTGEPWIVTALDRSSVVAVVGAGTMGQGIAQVALLAGHRVLLHDAVPGRAAAAAEGVTRRLDRLVEKGRLGAAEREDALVRLVAATGIADLSPARLVVEAVVEDLEVKRRLFAELEAVVADDCLLATNTSSLSVTAVASALRRPGRLVGLHFFNPAPLLPLVEVVAGAAGDPEALAAAHHTVAAWGKTPVRCTDTPGFLVNRVARPFYAEALRVYEERAADPATIDALLRESGGFAMGPFELTDLIGQDVNEAVTRSVWEAFCHDPKFGPSLAQRRLVESGRLGRKTGRGWFPYPTGNRAPGHVTPPRTATGSAVTGAAAPGAGGTGQAAAAGGVGAAAEARPRPHTAEPAEVPAAVTVTGDLGPASALLPLMAEAGIEVTERDPRAPHGSITLPDGTPLHLVDGRPRGRGEAVIRFDLALDYRSATRIGISPTTGVHAGAVAAATGVFQAMGKQVSVIRDVPGMVVARTVAMLADLALDAVSREVATPQDIDTAMRLGVNYPLGPLEWCERLSVSYVHGLLADLHAWYPAGRYAPCPELVRRYEAAGDVISS